MHAATLSLLGLTLGAAAYLVLFFPMVVFGRWLETRMRWKR